MACKHRLLAAPDSGYPPEIEAILVNRCAIAGCHNEASFSACDSLRLDTWQHLFEGDNSGAVIVPFSPQYSPLLYYVNTDSSSGPILLPLMPYQAKAPILSKAEYQTLVDWIAKGAPDKNGTIPFAADAATRQKIYVTMQDGSSGADLMAVIDARSKVIMRYLEIGSDPLNAELAHCVKCSGDGASAYVVFQRNGTIQKINTSTDQINGSANAGRGTSWSGAGICVDSANTHLLATNYMDATSGGKAISISTFGMIMDNYSYDDLVYPHAITANHNFDTFFATAQLGNTVYFFDDPSNRPIPLSIDGYPPVQSVDSSRNYPDPHDILMLPDYSKFVVSCQGTNEVRFMDAHSLTVADSISVGNYPQELAVSFQATTPYLFVSCQYGANPNPGALGSVYVINYQTLSVVKVLYGDFRQPHGIAVDDKDGLVYIFSNNGDGKGHTHGSVDGAKDGWYSIYDLKTLQPINGKRYITKTNTYSAAMRFQMGH